MIRMEVLAVSLATHISAVLLGISASSILFDSAWPVPALSLTDPSLVLALPRGFFASSSIKVGDPVQLARRVRGETFESCVMDGTTWSVLSFDPAILLARKIEAKDPVSLIDLDFLRPGLNSANEWMLQAPSKSPRCALAGFPAKAGVVIEKGEG